MKFEAHIRIVAMQLGIRATGYGYTAPRPRARSGSPGRAQCTSSGDDRPQQPGDMMVGRVGGGAKVELTIQTRSRKNDDLIDPARSDRRFSMTREGFATVIPRAKHYAGWPRLRAIGENRRLPRSAERHPIFAIRLPLTPE